MPRPPPPPTPPTVRTRSGFAAAGGQGGGPQRPLTAYFAASPPGGVSSSRLRGGGGGGAHAVRPAIAGCGLPTPSGFVVEPSLDPPAVDIDQPTAGVLTPAAVATVEPLGDEMQGAQVPAFLMTPPAAADAAVAHAEAADTAAADEAAAGAAIAAAAAVMDADEAVLPEGWHTPACGEGVGLLPVRAVPALPETTADGESLVFHAGAPAVAGVQAPVWAAAGVSSVAAVAHPPVPAVGVDVVAGASPASAPVVGDSASSRPASPPVVLAGTRAASPVIVCGSGVAPPATSPQPAARHVSPVPGVVPSPVPRVARTLRTIASRPPPPPALPVAPTPTVLPPVPAAPPAFLATVAGAEPHPLSWAAVDVAARVANASPLYFPAGWAIQRMPGVVLTPSVAHERQAARLAKRLVAARSSGGISDQWQEMKPAELPCVPSPSLHGAGAGLEAGGVPSEAAGSCSSPGADPLGDAVAVAAAVAAAAAVVEAGGVCAGDGGSGGPAEAPRLAPIFHKRRSSRVSATRAASQSAARAAGSSGGGGGGGDGEGDGDGVGDGIDNGNGNVDSDAATAAGRRRSSGRPTRAVRLAKPANGQFTLDAGGGGGGLATTAAAAAVAATAVAKRPRRAAPLHPFFTAPPPARSTGVLRAGGLPAPASSAAAASTTDHPLPPPPDAWLSQLSSCHVGITPPLAPTGRPPLGGGASSVCRLLPPPAAEVDSPDFSFGHFLDGADQHEDGTASSATLVAGSDVTINVDDHASTRAGAGDEDGTVHQAAWVDLYRLRAGVVKSAGGQQLATWIRRCYGSRCQGVGGGVGGASSTVGRRKRRRRSAAASATPSPADGAEDSTDGRHGDGSSSASAWGDSDGDSDATAGPSLGTSGASAGRPPTTPATPRGRSKRRRPDAGQQRFAVITGPTASGKTAVVYAVAAELGYSVLEVSAATLRSSGRGLLDRLAEATQSQRLARAPDSSGGSGSAAACAPTAASSAGGGADGASWATAARSLVLLDDAETLLADERLFWQVMDGLVRGDARRPVIFTVSSLEAGAGPVHRAVLRAAGSGGSVGRLADDTDGEGDGGFLVGGPSPLGRRGPGSRAGRLTVELIGMARPGLAGAAELLAAAAAEQRVVAGTGGDAKASRMVAEAPSAPAVADPGAALLAAACGRDLRAAVNALQFWGAPSAGHAVAVAPVSIAAAALGVGGLPLCDHSGGTVRCRRADSVVSLRAFEAHASMGSPRGGSDDPPPVMALYAACADAGLLHSACSAPPDASIGASKTALPSSLPADRPCAPSATAAARQELTAWARHLDVLSEMSTWADPPGLPLHPSGLDEGVARGGGGGDAAADGGTNGVEELGSKTASTPSATGFTEGSTCRLLDSHTGGDGPTAGMSESPPIEALLLPPLVSTADRDRVAGVLAARSLASCLSLAATHAKSAARLAERDGDVSVDGMDGAVGTSHGASVLTRLCAFANAAAPGTDADGDDGGATDRRAIDHGGGGCGNAELSSVTSAATQDGKLLRTSSPLLWKAIVIPHAQAAAVVPPSASRVTAAVDFFPTLRALALVDVAGVEEEISSAAVPAPASAFTAVATDTAAAAAAAVGASAAAAPPTAVALTGAPPVLSATAFPATIFPPPTLVGRGSTTSLQQSTLLPPVGGSSIDGDSEADVIVRPRRAPRPRRAAAPRRRPRLEQLGFDDDDVALLRACAMVPSWGRFHQR